MKILMIGGTGTISTAISRRLVQGGHDLFLINRGNANSKLPPQVNWIKADINDESLVAESLAGMEFDAVCEFIGKPAARRENEPLRAAVFCFFL